MDTGVRVYTYTWFVRKDVIFTGTVLLLRIRIRIEEY